MSELPPSGWYNDPENFGQLRYWDGMQWTDHRADTDAGPPESSTAPGPLSDVGSWLRETFRALWERKIQLLTLSAGLLVVWAVFGAAVAWSVDGTVYASSEWTGVHGDRIAATAIAGLIAFFLSLVVYLAVVDQLYRFGAGGDPSVGDSLGVAAQSAPRLVGWSLVLFAAAVIALAVVALLGAIAPPLALLFLAVFLPLAVWLFVKLSFFVIAIVAPQPGLNPIQASMRTSADGRFWPVLGRLVLIAIINVIVAVVLGIPFGGGSTAAGLEDNVVVVEGDEIIFFNVEEFVSEIGFGGGPRLLLSSIPQLIGMLIVAAGATGMYLDVHGRPQTRQ